jgi:hypothetical protein
MYRNYVIKLPAKLLDHWQLIANNHVEGIVLFIPDVIESCRIIL